MSLAVHVAVVAVLLQLPSRAAPPFPQHARKAHVQAVQVDLPLAPAVLPPHPAVVSARLSPAAPTAESAPAALPSKPAVSSRPLRSQGAVGGRHPRTGTSPHHVGRAEPVVASGGAATVAPPQGPATATEVPHPAAPPAGTDDAPAILAAPTRVVQAAYPPQARFSGVQGRVEFDLAIDARGVVQRARVVRSLEPACDEAARQALLQSRFRPARTRDGRAVACHLRYSVQFVLD